MAGLKDRLRSVLRLFKGEQVPFETTFAGFRKVLDGNNRALEIMTDMGEKLGGDYLFDIVYIRKAYADLAATVRGSIENFDTLTGGRYSGLPMAFEHIDSRIREVISPVSSGATGVMADEMVFFYNDPASSAKGVVGGKNANLAELKNSLGFLVPKGFAVTTQAFDRFMLHNGITVRVGEDLSDDALSKIRDSIISGELPPLLSEALEKALKQLRADCGGDCFLALRSSAVDEDGESSFAGQFETVLNVQSETGPVQEAYKRVLASLFSGKAVAYQRFRGYDLKKVKMSVGCQVMVDAVASGVVYTEGLGAVGKDSLVITAAWGTGEPIVEGEVETDLYRVRKTDPPAIIETKIGRKESMHMLRKGGGIEKAETPHELISSPCLTDEQVAEISRLAIRIESHFKAPQDIEWAVDREGRFVFLQARPLRAEPSRDNDVVPALNGQGKTAPQVIMENKGMVVQRGAGAGRVRIMKNRDGLTDFPRGAVLVARHDSSDFVRVMPYVSAIITDVGSPTSHMASLCREFMVPAIVSAGDATGFLSDGQEVTVVVDDDGGTVYEGIVPEIIGQAGADHKRMDAVSEFRRKRYILRYILPLHLIDPVTDTFSPEGCSTVHDILRFIHEKALAELVERARNRGRNKDSVALNLTIPAGIVVIDMGGALEIGPGQRTASVDRISSIPLRAVVQGLMHPGAWHSDVIPVRFGDFLSSMMRTPDVTDNGERETGRNVAVASREYMNLNIRFGYHFTLLDSYCSERARDNHIYFRFVGGATDISRRSRRVRLIESILSEFGFTIHTKGDVIIARLANIPREEMEDVLDQVGRLLAFSRQLDAVLTDDGAVLRYRENFMAGNYSVIDSAQAQ